MSWLFPAGIVSSLALVAIVVLHMRHRLPDVVAFPQLDFWPRVPSESRESPRWRKPPISALFLLQLLAALLLVLAFMRPALPDLQVFGAQRTGAVHHVIVLDGTTSMLATMEDGTTRWDAAKVTATDALEGWQQGDGASVIIAAARPQVRSAADARELDGLREWLAGLPLPGGSPDATAMSHLIGGTTLPDLSRSMALITDGGLDLGANAVSAERVVIGEAAGNVAIISTSVTPRDGGGQIVEATVLQDRAGTETIPWVARSDGQVIDSGTVTLGSGQTGTISAGVPTGTEQVTLEIAVDDALPADNRVVFPLTGDALTSTRIVLVSDVPGPTQRALEVLPGAVVENYPTTTPGIAAIAAGADLVVYEGSAPDTSDLPTVPMLLVQPTGFGEHWQLTGVAPDPVVTDLRLDDPVLRDVALEGVRFGETPIYVLDPDADVLATGLDSESEVPLVWRGTIEEQLYVAWAFDPAASSLADRVSFPVLVAQTVDSLVGASASTMVGPGTLVMLPVDAEAARVRVITPQGRIFTVQPSDSGTISLTTTAEAGLWSLVVEDSEGVEIGSGSLVVTVGDATESRLRSGEPILLSPAVPEGAEPVSDSALSTLTDIWPLLVVAAIAIIGIEWWLWLARSIGGRRRPEGEPA